MNNEDETGRGIAGGLYATLISSICCIIPIILLILGIGLSFGLVISMYRPYFILAGIVFAGVYIFIHVWRKSGKCGCSTTEMVRREEKFIMSTIFTFILGLLLINFLVIPLLSNSVLKSEDNINSITDGKLTAVKLRIDGMTCESCAGIIQEKLMKMKGVFRADISYRDVSGTVVFDPQAISVNQILEGIKPYSGTVISEWEVKK